ncbi:alpha/beta hydrolase family protein [Bacillus sp. NPDC077027]|uniref:alpha/beta hydrolase family protein n=1 Tax=Bacillus sp. NPDC077027 TaxID=3390548 RepID=UPI003CFDD688
MIVEKRRFPSPHPHIHLYTVTYWADGLRIKGLLAEPAASGTYDGFLYLRGGIKSVGMVRPGRIIQFAAQGFVVFAPFYRGNQGGEGNEDFAGEDRQDAFSAYQLLKQHPKVKRDHIHIFGFSRGGIMGIWTAIEMKEGPASLVSWGGVSDMRLTYEERVDMRRMMKRVIGGAPQKVPNEYDLRTPLDEVRHIQAPVLLIHGKRDENVSIEHALLFEEALKKYGKSVETWYFDQYDHYIPPKQNREIVKRLTEWMKSRKRGNVIK